MTKTLHGKVHGKRIDLDEDLEMAVGQEVVGKYRAVDLKVE